MIYSTPAFDASSDKPEVRRFVEGFRKKYNEEPEATSGHAYDAIMILAHVMRNHGTDPETIKEGLYAIKDFAGVTGVTTFDEHGDVVKNVFIKRITDGVPSLLEEFRFGE